MMHNTIENWNVNEHTLDVQQESLFLRIILDAVVETLCAAFDIAFVSGKPFILKGDESLSCDFSVLCQITGGDSLESVQVSAKKECFTGSVSTSDPFDTDLQSRFDKTCLDIHKLIQERIATVQKLVLKPELGPWKIGKWPAKTKLVVPFGFNSNQVAFVEFFLKHLVE